MDWNNAKEKTPKNGVYDVIVKNWDSSTDEFIYRRYFNVEYSTKNHYGWDQNKIPNDCRVEYWMEIPKFDPIIHNLNDFSLCPIKKSVNVFVKEWDYLTDEFNYYRVADVKCLGGDEFNWCLKGARIVGWMHIPELPKEIRGKNL